MSDQRHVDGGESVDDGGEGSGVAGGEMEEGQAKKKGRGQVGRAGGGRKPGKEIYSERREIRMAGP